MLLRNFLLSLLIPILLTVYASSRAETLYVRPADACAFSGDGSAYSCATSPGSGGAWTGLNGFSDTSRLAANDAAGRINPGDTLYVCGSFTGQFNFGQLGGPLGSGRPGAPITINWDCSGDPGRINGAFNNFAFYTEQNYLTIRDMQASGGQLQVVYIVPPQADQSVERYVTILGGEVSDCTAPNSACVQLIGRHITVDGLHVTKGHVVTDSLNIRGQNNLLSNVKCSLSENVHGPCIQLEGESQGTVVERAACNYGNYSLADSCVSAAAISDEGLVTVKETTGSIGKDSEGAFIDLGTSAKITGNICRGGGIGCIRAIGSPSAIVEVTNNILTGNAKLGHVLIGHRLEKVTVSGNSISPTKAEACISSYNRSAQTSFYNNTLSNCTVGIDKRTDSQNADSYNYFEYAIPAKVRRNFVLVSPGPGSVVYSQIARRSARKKLPVAD